MRLLGFASLLVLVTCADDRPFLSGHIKRAADAIMTPCDPYNQGSLHTCVVYASAFSQKLLVYDATAEEMVLAPMVYFPLSIKVGAATNDLALVKGSKKPPFFLALDHSEPALYVVRNFPSTDKSRLSFAQPSKLKLSDNPTNLAAYLSSTHAVVILTYPTAGQIELRSLDSETGDLDAAVAPERISIGAKPSDLVISDDGKMAYIIEEGSHEIWVLDLTTRALRSINAGTPVDQIFFSQRDFGDGLKNYLAILSKTTKELHLINADDSVVEASLILDEYPMTAYFPDADCQTCCNGEKNWLSVAGIKGNLFTIVVKNLAAKLSLEKAEQVDLTSERNLVLSKLSVKKILGGKVEFDASLKRPAQCLNNRNIYIVSSYGSDRSRLLSKESYEVEAQGQGCEGESAASRLGYKRE